MQKWLSFIRAALRGDEYDLTQGNTRRAIAILAIPMMLEMAMESIFALVDTFFVGHLGVEALSTIGITEVVLTLIYAVAIGLSTAPMAMVARYIGQKDEKSASKAARQALWLAIIISLLIGIPGFIYAPDILRLMGGSETMVAQGQNYTRIMFGSNIVIMLLFLLNGIFRGAGEAAKAMRVLWLSNGINIVLDPVLIFGWGPFPEMGITGAAVATSIGRGIGVLYQLYILFGGFSVIKMAAGRWQIDLPIMRRLSNIAANGAFQYLISSASWIFLMRIVAQSGDAAVAAYTIAIRLIVFTLLPAWGLANAAATFVGQNLGAKQPKRAEKGVWEATFLVMVYMFIIGLFYMAFAPSLIGLFTQDPEALPHGITALRILGGGYILFGLGLTMTQAFNGAGDTKTPAKINFVAFWLLEIPLGYFLGIHLGFEVAGVCWAIVLAEGALALAAYYFFKQGKWKTTVV